MGFLQELFGPSKARVWRMLSERLRGEFVDGGWFGQDKVQVRVRHWIITLDTYSEGNNNSSQFTRLRAPYVNRAQFRFRVYRKGVFTGIGKALGFVKDFEVGHPRFDDAFVISGNDPAKLRLLFSNARIRGLLRALPKVDFRVANGTEWWHGRYPKGVDELYFRAPGTIKDISQLEFLFDLFGEVLHQICHLDPAYEDDVNLTIAELLGPSGRIERDNVVLWDGNDARYRAARKLEELKDPRAIPPFSQILKEDKDQTLRAVAIRALGSIGDKAAIPTLLLLIGHSSEGAPARQALQALGGGDIVEEFNAAIAGDEAVIDRLVRPPHGALLLIGLKRMLAQRDNAPMDRARAARVLAKLAHIEAVPEIKKALRDIRKVDRPHAREMLQEALQALEQRSALPRPAKPVAGEQRLPRPATSPGTRENLPRGVPPDSEE